MKCVDGCSGLELKRSDSDFNMRFRSFECVKSEMRNVVLGPERLRDVLASDEINSKIKLFYANDDDGK